MKMQMMRRNGIDLYVGGEEEITPTKAFNRLLVYEIGYGGRIITLDDNTIEVETIVLGTIDTTRITGECENFKKIYRFCKYFVSYSRGVGVINELFRDIIMSEKTFVLKHLLKTNSAASAIRNAAATVIWERSLFKEREILERIQKMSLNNISVLLELVLFDNANITDALSLFEEAA